MLYFGLDVLSMGAVGVLVIIVVYLFCLNRVTDTDGRSAVLASAFTVVVMLVSYVIMAHVLDSIVGAM